MSEQITKYETGITAEIAEALVVEGDLSKLTPAQRVEYYSRVCQSLGLNPLTRPFQYIRLNGKLVLYATRDATDQLRRRLGISVHKVREEYAFNGTMYIIEVEAELDGRKDFATAAVSLEGLSGDAKCNAIMKAETKAKRRVTLSIAGLGFLDETEVSTIPEAEPANGDAVYPESLPAEPPPAEPVTDAQLKMIHVAKRKLGLSDEQYRTLLAEYGVQSSKDLTKEQASQLIERFTAMWQERQQKHPEAEQPESSLSGIKHACLALGWGEKEAIAIRAAIREANVDEAKALDVLEHAESKMDALRGLGILGVRNPFSRAAGA